MLSKKSWWVIFLVLLLADLVCLSLDFARGHFWLKTLLMPVLLVSLINHKKNAREKNWRIIMAGLIMAWAGDVLLLFSDIQQLFFIMGLCCFLLTHLAYIYYFYQYKKGKNQWFGKHPIATVLVIAYSIVLFGILSSHLGGLLIPVAFYTLVITLMLLQALSAQPFIDRRAAGLFVAGAILFVASDSALAIDKFYKPFPMSNVFIMTTYGVAQMLIVMGAIRNTDERKTIG